MKLTPDTQIQWQDTGYGPFLGLGRPKRVVILCWDAVDPIKVISFNTCIWCNINDGAIVWMLEDQP